MSHASATLAYRSVAASQSSTVGLVIALYDALHEKLCRAVAAMRRDNIEERSNELKRGFSILTQLHVLLDREDGGKTAADLHQFYEYLRKGMLRAQFQQSPEVLYTLCDSIQTVKSAWQQIETRETMKPEREEILSPQAASHENRSLDCTA